MKSSMKLIIVASAILLAALLVNPAAAFRGASIKTIVSGDHIFVYETGLCLAALDADPGTGTAIPTALRKFVDDDVKKAIIKEIPVNPGAFFDVTSGLVGGVYGVYYPYSSAVGYTVPDKANGGQSVTIQATDLQLGIYLNVTTGAHVDSIDGKSITRYNNITFKISAPNVATYYRDQNGVPEAQADVQITTPNGGVLTVFGGNSINLAKINVTAAEFYTDSPPQGGLGAINLTNVDAGTYTAVLKFSSTTPFYKQAGTDSNAVTFTVLSKPVTIVTNKETVVRGNNFVVTITAESNKNYYVFLKAPSVSGTKTPPFILDGQPGVNNTLAAYTEMNAKLSSQVTAIGTAAIVLTKADGTRSIEFNTSTTTDDKKFTVKVLDPRDQSKYDQVDVSVEKGKITITYEGTGSYYLGETIKLTGTNTDSKKVYLFVKGPNLGEAGRSMANLSQITSVGCNNPPPAATEPDGCWKIVDVNTDNTWSFKWDTSKLSPLNLIIDAGTYTIYAVGDKADGTTAGLAEKTYQTASVILKKPFITASASTNTLAKGDILYIRGTAEGKPSNVYVWIFGKNYRDMQNSVSVRSDATYEYKFERSKTTGLYAGQYFVVVQHPMMNGQADICADASGISGTSIKNCTAQFEKFGPVVLVGLQASDAATALVDALNSPNVDDTYTKLSFNLEEPWIRIDTIGDKYVGDTFKITGTTNLAEGDQILITVVSSSFKPTEKTQTGEFSGASGTVTVQKGDTYNTFSFDVDASTFKPDEYLVKAEAIEPSQTATATFNVLEGAPTTVAPVTTPPAAVTTAPATPPPTAATTAVPATTVKPQPGFGALVALVGLGAVALLVLRRH